MSADAAREVTLMDTTSRANGTHPDGGEHRGGGLRRLADRAVRLLPPAGIPGVLVPGIEARQVRRKPVHLQMLGDDLVLFRDKAGAGRRPERLVPAPRRAAVPRPLRVRGHRHLPVPRLRLRRHGAVRGRPDRASRLPVHRQAARPRLSDRGAHGHRLRVDGPDGARAARRGPARRAVRPGADADGASCA